MLGFGDYMAALGLDGSAPADDRPASIRDLLVSVGPGTRPHSEAFAYATPVTDTLGWLLERADDRDGGDGLAALWAEVGAEHDALLTRDPEGTALMGAGLAMTTRDLARFGVLLSDAIAGRAPADTALDGAVLDTIRDSGDPDAFQRGGHYAYLEGYSYRDQWWLPGGSSRPLSAWGIHGQVLWIDPDAERRDRLPLRRTAAERAADATSSRTRCAAPSSRRRRPGPDHQGAILDRVRLHLAVRAHDALAHDDRLIGPSPPWITSYGDQGRRRPRPGRRSARSSTVRFRATSPGVRRRDMIERTIRTRSEPTDSTTSGRSRTRAVHRIAHPLRTKPSSLPSGSAIVNFRVPYSVSNSGSTTWASSFTAAQSASGSSTVKLKRPPRPAATMTAKVAPPLAAKWA